MRLTYARSLALVLSVFLQSLVFVNAQRSKTTINESWSFCKGAVANAQKVNFKDSAWQKINLPHTWNAEDSFDDEPGYYRGIGWYRKRIFINEAFKNKQLFLYFEAANQTATVYVNGQLAGTHVGGYAGFCFNISAFALFNKENIIAVEVSNAHNENVPPLSGDWSFYGGIYRDVFLVATNNLHFNMTDFASPGIFIETPTVNNDNAVVKVRGSITNQTSAADKIELVTKLINASGEIIDEKKSLIQTKANGTATFEQLTNNIAKPNLWSPSNPYLYTLSCGIFKNGVLVDELKQSVGLRWYTCDAENGFILNGKPLRLNGACRTQDYPQVGFAIPDELNRYDAKLLKEMGVNFLRVAHYNMDPAFLEEMDRLGIMVWEEIPISDVISSKKAFSDISHYMVKEMIRQDYNHPSIIMWGNMNEVFLMASKTMSPQQRKKYEEQVLELATQLEILTHKEDPYRLTGAAFHGDRVYVKAGLHKVTDVVGWNLYSGWYGGKFEDFSERMDAEHKEYPTKPIIISEYGAGSDKRINSLHPETYDFSNQYAQLFHEYYYAEIAKRKFIVGSNIWNFMDFGSEKREESMAHINNKGVVYFNREKKDIFYYYKAAFTESPVIHIASRDWAYRKGTQLHEKEKKILQPLKVYSNLPEVELWVNGLSTGKKKVENYFAVWDVALQACKNTIEAIGYLNGKKESDMFYVDAAVQPMLLNDASFKELAVNTGASYQFCNPTTHFVWEEDQPYQPGSWGYIGGEVFRIKKGRIGNINNIRNTDEDAIYQTARIGMDAYQFDVANGEYEVELRFNEPNANPDQIFYDLSQVTNNAELLEKRMFNVTINKQMVLKDLNLAKEYGVNTAIYFKYTITAINNKGINIAFYAQKGKSTISGIRIVKK